MSVQRSIVNQFIPLIVFSSVCTLAFVVAEVAVRGIGFAHPVQTQSDFHLGYALVAGAITHVAKTDGCESNAVRQATAAPSLAGVLVS